MAEVKEFTFNDGGKLYAQFNGEGDEIVSMWADANESENDRYCDLTFHTFSNVGNVASVERRVIQEGNGPYVFDMSLITSSSTNVAVLLGVQASNGSFVNVAWNVQGESGYSGTNYVNTWTNSTTEHNYNVTIGKEDFGDNVFFVNTIGDNTASITSANIVSNMPLVNLANCFNDCYSLASFESGALRVSNLYSTFSYCNHLTTLDGLQNWDTSNVTSLSDTFNYCRNLTTLEPLANWDTSNVTSLFETFNYCRNLTTLDGLQNWDTSNVTNMYSTYTQCQNLTDISALASWNMSKVEDLRYTFSQCYNLTDISPLANWNLINATDFRFMFLSCNHLTNISAINTWSNAINANCAQMFRQCNALTGSVEIHFNIVSAARMFENTPGAKLNVYASTKTNAYNAIAAEMVSNWGITLYPLDE